ncbi:MAG: nucleotidyltransferase domain-containing protein [Longimicrobiales bacterium]|nr:nucleotidyltransferase domain-containing protein [Longimicrobiales bacterium]
MSPTVQALAEQVLPILQRYGVRRAGVFGSHARGDAREDSDLDLLVDLPEGSSLLDLVGLQLDLGDVLGISVDAHTYRSLHHLLRDRILSEEVRIL